MKKIFCIILILALFTALVPITALAAENDDVYYATSRVALAFRDADGEYLKDMPEGEIFTVLKIDPRDSERVWVNWNGEEGSVIESGIIRISNSLAGIEMGEEKTNEAYTNCGLNFRIAETYEYILTIPEGSRVTIIGNDSFNNERVIVEYNGIEGSVLKSGLFLTSGASYILVDIDNQRVTMYKDGMVLIEDDVVTGTKGTRDTPKGFFVVDSMQHDAILRGEDYETPVKFWMPFCDGCGLHDASWRNSFGGNIYEWDGSHGCVNMRFSTAKIIFENAYVGMALIVV